jgi:origin recognition complex subunit 1
MPEQETVLYSFFDWPLRAVPSAKLIVVGIANTLNLPERLSPKLSSRMGQKRIFFGAYNDEEIVTIIKERLGMVGNMHDVRLVVT